MKKSFCDSSQPYIVIWDDQVNLGIKFIWSKKLNLSPDSFSNSFCENKGHECKRSLVACNCWSGKLFDEVICRGTV